MHEQNTIINVVEDDFILDAGNEDTCEAIGDV